MKLLVLTPVGYNHSPYYWLSMLKLQSWCIENNILLEYSYNRISNIYYARETLIKKATDHDFVLWIDSDCQFEPEQVKQLMDHDKEFISGVAKFTDQANKCQKWNYGRYLPVDAIEKLGVWMANHLCTEENQTELLKADFVGLHFALMKPSAIKDIPENYRFEPLPMSLIHKSLPGYMSEDGAFCWKLKKAGVDVWIDPQCITGHHKDYILR